MPKNIGWIQPLTNSLFILLQSFFWLNVLNYIYHRVNEPLLSEGAIIWLVITAWIIMLPLPKLSTSQKNIWFFATLIAGSVIGYLLFNDIVTSIILLVGVSFLSVKKIVDGIGAKQFSTSLMTIMIVFSIFFLLSYFIIIDQAEIFSLIQFLIFAFLITIMGMLFTQLSNHDGHVFRNRFFKQWGVYIGWIWLAIALIAIGSVGILLGLSIIYPLLIWLFKMLLTPLIVFVTEVILPWLQEGFANMMENAPEPDESELDWQQGEVILPDTLKGLSPTATLIWNIVIFSILIVVIMFLTYKFYKYIRDQFEKRNSTDSDSQKRDSDIKVQAIQTSPDHQSSLWDKLRGIFRPYSDREEHMIRKQYRDMLKLMKKKGLWNNEAMTAHQLNQLVQGFDYSSSLYERLRYGDQELSEKEIELYREEIQKIMNDLKK